MKTIVSISLGLLFGLATAQAGVVSTEGGKICTSKPCEGSKGCGWNAGDITVGLYAAGILPEDGHLDEGLGGGISLGYTICENFSIELDATWLENDSTIHAFTASGILRYPIDGLCIAPYLIGGGGVSTNSATQGIVHLGGGLEWKCQKTSHSIFAEGRYVWADETENYTLVRGGLKFEF